MMNWNKNTDCCKWDGVSCNHFTGDVIGINLSCGMLRGTIYPNTTLFRLPHLQRLNLAYNDFTASQLPREISRFSSRLTHLNISESGFTSEISSEFLFLPKWISLDLSRNDGMRIQPFVLSNLLQNSSYLRELLIPDVDVGWVLPTYLNISSSLKSLDLRSTRLQGKLPRNIFNLQYLETLDLSDNEVTGSLPKVVINQSSLISLDLSGNRLQGKLPANIFNIQNLEILDLSSNDYLTGPLPDVNMSINTPLKFVGHLPRIYLQNFSAMKDVIRMSPQPEYVNMGGVYYSVIIAVKGQLLPFPKITIDYTIVDLSYNKFEGEIPSIIGDLTSLIVLDLSHNSLIGGIPVALGKMAQIESLDLSWNQLTKEIPRILVDLTFLAFLNLSQNHLVGRIPTGKQFDTFEGKSFGGNPELCGLPLSKKCEIPHEPKIEDDEDTEFGITWRVVMWGYGGGTLLGLVMGYIMLSTRKPTWLHAIVDAGEHMIQTRQRERSYADISGQLATANDVRRYATIDVRR
ncbi:hypothetical protein L1887_09000 [Cichorium endivia]|nr:hypothetical protein L1887_09000 [Cichorium endivia]